MEKEEGRGEKGVVKGREKGEKRKVGEGAEQVNPGHAGPGSSDTKLNPATLLELGHLSPLFSSFGRDSPVSDRLHAEEHRVSRVAPSIRKRSLRFAEKTIKSSRYPRYGTAMKILLKGRILFRTRSSV